MPPRPESLRKCGEWLVISESPDVCLTPMGPALVPVPYSIVARGALSTSVTSKTNFGGVPVFHLNSHIPNVEGDEAGTGGGLVSGVNRGVCYPLAGSTTVKVERFAMIRHDDKFAMNAAGPKAPGNTTGHAVWCATPDSDPADGEGPAAAAPAGQDGAGAGDASESAGNNSAGSGAADADGQPAGPETPKPEQSWYAAAKDKLDQINKSLHAKEIRFRQALDKLGDVILTPGGGNIPPDQILPQLAEGAKEGAMEVGEAIISLPGRLYSDPAGTVADIATGVATAPFEAVSDLADGLSSGQGAKAFGKLFSSILGDKAKGVAVDNLKIGMGPEARLERAEGKLAKSKAQLKDAEKAVAKVNKQLEKSGGRIQGGPAKRAQKATRAQELKSKREELRNQRDAARDKFDAAKERASTEAARNTEANQKISEVTPDTDDLTGSAPQETPAATPAPSKDDCPDVGPDGKAILYLGGKCDTKQ